MNTTSNKSVRKVFRVQYIAISSAILVLGLLLIVYAQSLNWLGYSLLFTGAFMLPFYKTGYKVPGENGVFLKKDYILHRENVDEIAEYNEGRSTI